LIFNLKNFREAAVLYKQRYPDKNYSSKKIFRNISIENIEFAGK